MNILYQMFINLIGGLIATSIVGIPIYYATRSQGEKKTILKPLVFCVCFSLAYALSPALNEMLRDRTIYSYYETPKQNYPLLIANIVVFLLAGLASHKICTTIDEKTLRKEAENASVSFENYIISKVPEDIIAKCETYKGNAAGLNKVLKGNVDPIYKRLLIKIYTYSDKY